jgi:hypothetical protein
MTKKPKQSKKGAKHSKRTKVAAPPEEEPDTVTTFSPAETPESISVSPQTEATEVPVESQQATVVDTSVAQAAGTEAAPKTTRNDAAKANIKEGLRLHQIAGRPTKAQLILVFGQNGYLLTWPKRTERFGITPETFQAALAKGVPAVPLTPVAKSSVEKTKGTA